MIKWVILVAFLGSGGLVLGIRGWLGMRGWPSMRYPSLTAASPGTCIPGGLGMLVLCAFALTSGTTKFVLLWVVNALFLTSAVYLVVYLQFGVPDWLRPRPQRGLAKGEYTVARLWKFAERRQLASSKRSEARKQ